MREWARLGNAPRVVLSWNAQQSLPFSRETLTSGVQGLLTETGLGTHSGRVNKIEEEERVTRGARLELLRIVLTIELGKR